MYDAILRRLASISLPVLEEGCVPQGQTFPYLTLRVEPACRSNVPGAVTLTAWCCGDQAHADRLALADQLLTLLPPRGFPLTYSGGRSLLYMKDSQVRCLQQGPALGVQLTWALRCFTTV